MSAGAKVISWSVQNGAPTTARARCDPVSKPGASNIRMVAALGSSVAPTSNTASAGSCRRSRMPGSLRADRKSVVEGKSVSVRVELGGSRLLEKKKQNNTHIQTKYQPTRH